MSTSKNKRFGPFRDRLRNISEAQWQEFLTDFVPSDHKAFTERAFVFLRMQLPDELSEGEGLLRLSLAARRVLGYQRKSSLYSFPMPPLLCWQELKDYAVLLGEALLHEVVLPNRFMARLAEQLSCASLLRCVDTNAVYVTINDEAVGVVLGETYSLEMAGRVRDFVVLAHANNYRHGLLGAEEILGHALETLAARRLG